METIEIRRNKFSFVTKERNINMVKSSFINSFIKPRCKISIQQDNDSQSTIANSIISTAEQHLKSQIMLSTNDLHSDPKLTSSTLTLLNQEDTNSITFNVDFASTPKKIIQRSSTPKILQQPKTITKQFKSSVVKQAKLLSKMLPPPLLTSSFQTERKEKKRKIRSSNCKCCLSTQSKRPKLVINTETPTYKSHKFPIKYLNSKTIDINRLDFNQNCKLYGCPHHSDFNLIQPSLPNQSQICYQLGDYKLWII